MIDFKEGHIPEQKLTTLTAYISQVELLMHGKNLVREVIHQLVKQSVFIYRIKLENIVNEIVLSPETRQYIDSKIKECIDKAIQAEINEMFGKKT